MSSPPFNPNEGLPLDSGVVALFPAQERTFRDIIESWLLWEHDRSGYHSFDMDTTVNRDADTTRPAGSIFYNTTLEVLQFCFATTPAYIWDTISFPPGTRLLFNNAAAPVGWSKVTDAEYDDATIVIRTGTPAAPSGVTGFDDLFKEGGITGAVDGTAISEAQMPNHRHQTIVNSATGGTGSSPSANNSPYRSVDTDSSANYTLRFVATEPTIGRTSDVGNSETHSHDFSLDLDVKRVEFILCEKDALE